MLYILPITPFRVSMNGLSKLFADFSANKHRLFTAVTGQSISPLTVQRKPIHKEVY